MPDSPQSESSNSSYADLVKKILKEMTTGWGDFAKREAGKMKEESARNQPPEGYEDVPVMGGLLGKTRQKKAPTPTPTPFASPSASPSPPSEPFGDIESSQYREPAGDKPALGGLSGVPVIDSAQAYESLAPGAVFIDKDDGEKYVKPKGGGAPTPTPTPPGQQYMET
jgi:hypothetical protein